MGGWNELIVASIQNTKKEFFLLDHNYSKNQLFIIYLQNEKFDDVIVKIKDVSAI